MNSRKKIIVLSVMGIALAFGVKEGIRKYPDIKSDFLEQKRRDEIYNLSGVDDAGENFHARIDTLMAFVHNNSEHNIDDEFCQTSGTSRARLTNFSHMRVDKVTIHRT